MRKFFIADFNEVTDFIRKKRKFSSSFYIECLRSYITSRNILECGPIHGMFIGASVDSIVFCLGSLIYPKDMIKYYSPDVGED